ncbi:MAG: AAA family ATPase [Spirochaetota bacterium]
MRKIPGYEIIEKVNQNLIMEIYRVQESNSENTYIVKFVSLDRELDQNLLHLKNEYEILQLFTSDRIIKPLHFQNQKDGNFLLMEDGGTSLKQLIKKDPIDSLEQFLQFAITITDGLGEIHRQKIVHKDIKPSNIVLQKKDAKTIKFIDFGISTRLKREEMGWQSPNVLEGSLPYISPEQTGRVNRAIDYRTDFYSLGITFFEMLTGELPFPTNDPIELIHSHIALAPPLVHEIKNDVPEILSKIIYKLLEKDAEKRYNSAYGLKYDLEKCLELIQNQSSSKTINMENFPLGTKDPDDVFKIPQKLYGRVEETKQLVAIFEEVASGSARLLLVSGYSGIGKSAFIQETHKPITEKKGFFIQGKFDQFQKNIPFSAILNAFRELVKFLLTEPDDRIRHWKEELDSALGRNAQVIIDVIPELELVLGQKQPVSILSASENQNRFNLTFQNFISVFARREHPIVLFIDDLQWADKSSLKLIESIITNPDNKYLMIIGAYRDNEVDTGHPLLQSVAEIKKSGSEVETIRLGPLQKESITELLTDTFHVNGKEEGLAEILNKKTGGNPFFISEFLKSLYKDEIIDFNYETNKWQWQEERVHSYGMTDNVVDLMVKNIQNFSEHTANILSLASCLGNQFDLKFLSIVSELALEQLVTLLWPAIEEGVLIPLGKSQQILQTATKGIEQIEPNDLGTCRIRFQHDRVQQAAYSLLDDTKKKEIHYKAGNLILANISEEERNEKIFDIVGHLNEGKELVQTEEERIVFIDLNLKAGQKAKLSTAYESAINFLESGRELVKEEDWHKNYQLIFSLVKELSENYYLNGRYEEAEEIYPLLLKKANDELDKIQVYFIQLEQYQVQMKFDLAVEIELKGLQILGIDLPAEDEAFAALVEEELALVAKNLGSREIADLIDSPEMQDKHQLNIMYMLSYLFISTWLLGKQTTVTWSIIKMTNLSQVHGNCEVSSLAYANYGFLSAYVFSKVNEGYEYGNLALELSQKFDNVAFRGKVYFLYAALISHWKKKIDLSDPIQKEAHQLCVDGGDYAYAAYAINKIIDHHIFSGKNLEEIYKEALSYYPFLKKNNPFLLDTFIIPGSVQAIQSLRGETDALGSFDDESFSEDTFLEQYKDNPLIHAWFFAEKIKSLYLAEQTSDSLGLADKVGTIVATCPGHIRVPESYFYTCLSILAETKNLPEGEKEAFLGKLQEYQSKLQSWSKDCPDNFEHKYLLVEAEKARDEGDGFAAISLYERAIESAKKYEFINNEALCNELCAKFWIGKENIKYATLHMSEAYKLYNKWGAFAKCKQLQAKYSAYIKKDRQPIWKMDDTLEKTITTDRTIHGATNTFTQSLDLTSILRASQAISKEIEYEKLLERLIKILIENAGAERVVFISRDENGFCIDADGMVGNKNIYQHGSQLLAESKSLPLSVINYVTRSKHPLVLVNAGQDKQFSSDDYFSSSTIKSVLCAPLSSKGKLTGLIYLENNVTSGAFTEERVNLLQTIASQAAISIENAKLYANIENVTREKTKVSTQMEIAEQIQTSLLVEEAHFVDYEFFPFMQTSDEVGGDYYDLIQRPEGEWFVIGDVSGHGVTAGLIMMMVQTAIHTAIKAIGSSTTPGDILKCVNDVISENVVKMKLDKYMTITLILKQKDVFYHSGLHENIIIYRSEKREIESLKTYGSWLGMKHIFDDFPVNSFELQSGDIILLHTDGITEALDADNNMFNESGLANVLLQNSGEDLPSIKTKILEKLQAYRTDDDVTLAMLRKK